MGWLRPSLSGFVDVGSGGDARFKHGESFVADEGIDARGDKAGSLVHEDGFFVHAMSDGNTGGDGVL